jgi:hypothetical protein
MDISRQQRTSCQHEARFLATIAPIAQIVDAAAVGRSPSAIHLVMAQRIRSETHGLTS